MAESHDTEVWKPVVGFEGLYEVSSLGSVRNLRKPWAGHVLKPRIGRKGYLDVGLSRDGRGHTTRVHRIVAEAFIGKRPEGCVCRHADGDKSNNALSNLAWGTYKENEADKIKHGTTNRGEACGHAKLTEDDVRAIRRLNISGIAKKALARMYGVTHAAITAICARRTWKCVE